MRSTLVLTLAVLFASTLTLSQNSFAMSGNKASDKQQSAETPSTPKYNPNDDSMDRGQTISDDEFMNAVKDSFIVNNENDWQRFSDPTLKICNETRDRPNMAQIKDIIAREKAYIVLPKNGQYMGDWRKGEKWAKGAAGGRIGIKGFKDADDPSVPNGANCYACHAVDPNFPQNGNMGPSLTNYGKIRGNTTAMQKYTYDKIFDSKSIVPCSLMPRYGAGYGHLLTPEQVADLVAFLLDPESPVNNPKSK